MKFNRLLSFYQRFMFADAKNFKLHTAQLTSDTFFWYGFYWCKPTKVYLHVAARWWGLVVTRYDNFSKKGISSLRNYYHAEMIGDVLRRT